MMPQIIRSAIITSQQNMTSQITIFSQIFNNNKNPLLNTYTLYYNNKLYLQTSKNISLFNYEKCNFIIFKGLM